MSNKEIRWESSKHFTLIGDTILGSLNILFMYPLYYPITLSVGPYCDQPEVTCSCNSPCGPSEVCNMQNGAPVCGCPPCMTGPFCDVPVDSCACNNPCNDPTTCQDISGSAQCICDCVGNEECRTNPATNQPECKCPLCYYNSLPGQRGCASGKDCVSVSHVHVVVQVCCIPRME